MCQGLTNVNSFSSDFVNKHKHLLLKYIKNKSKKHTEMIPSQYLCKVI